MSISFLAAGGLAGAATYLAARRAAGARARRPSERRAAVPALPVALVAVGCGLLAATPVRIGWKACNHHTAWASGGVAVVTLIGQPEEPKLVFSDYSTLVACLPGIPSRVP
jgi:hypothetical protein